MDDILKYLLMLAPGLLQGLTRPGGQQATQQRTTIADLPERRFEGIAENINAQMARAGQPRRTVSTSTLTQPEEPLNWGNLMMILMMLMQGQGAGSDVNLPVTPGQQGINIYDFLTPPEIPATTTPAPRIFENLPTWGG